jgi:hypothetical protein
MKRLVLLFALIALVLPLSANAVTVSVIGWALEDNGSLCGSDCQALAQVRWHANGATASAGPGNVSGGTSSCYGQSYNFGSVTNFPGCSPTFNPGFNISAGSNLGNFTVSTWVRHSCPFGGFYYSPTASQGLTSWNVATQFSWYAGTLRLYKPAGGCFAAIITDAGIKAALVG